MCHEASVVKSRIVDDNILQSLVRFDETVSIGADVHSQYFVMESEILPSGATIPKVYISDPHFKQLYPQNVINGIYGSMEGALSELIDRVEDQLLEDE